MRLNKPFAQQGVVQHGQGLPGRHPSPLLHEDTQHAHAGLLYADCGLFASHQQSGSGCRAAEGDTRDVRDADDPSLIDDALHRRFLGACAQECGSADCECGDESSGHDEEREGEVEGDHPPPRALKVCTD
ncbi:hypothetical protein D3C87_1477150 [compost metagenome]